MKSIIVIGGGFAGVTAARNLSRQGYKVTLLEARDRLGGRTHTRKFADTDVEIETGGAWFAGPKQKYVHREVVAHGLRYKSDPPVTTFSHLLGGKRIETPSPITPEEYLSFERASFHILNAAQHVDASRPVELNPLAAYDITWDQFMSQIEISPTMRDYFDTQGLDAAGGLGTEDASAITHLWLTALYGHSVVNWGTMIDQQLEGGTKALLEAIKNDAPAVDIRLGTPVASVEQSGEQVTVTTVEGDEYIADGVVVALPVNCWKDVQFDPPLSSDKVNGAALQPGTRGAKTWALVENAPSGFLGYSNVEAGHGLTTLNFQAEVDGNQLMFGLSPVGKRDGITDAFDPLDKTHVQRAVEAFIPGAKVLEVDGEDWNTSPWSNGSWSTFRIGQMEYLSGMRRPEGRLAFAGSDICRGWLTWIDGAIESGTYAAAELDRIISSH